MRHFLLGVSLLAAAPVLGAASSADAGVRVRIGGSASISIGGGPRIVHRRVVRHRVRPPVYIGGSIHVGGYVEPPPPPPVYAYEGSGYVGVYQQPAVAVAPARPALPRFGVGVFAGGIAVEGQDAGSDLGLAGRLRLTPGLLLDGELAQSELAGAAQGRIDRRLAAGLTYELSPYAQLTPQLLGAVGVTQSEVDGAWTSNQSFGELGVGLRYAATPRVHLSADVRLGSRSLLTQDEPAMLDAQARVVAPPADETEEYTSARVAAMLYF